MTSQNDIGAIDTFLEIISHARKHPEMYFKPIGPIAVTHWLWGLRTGIKDWRCISWSPEHRQEALKPRGLEFWGTVSEAEQLESRGLAPGEVVDELLAIEIEMWQRHRDAISHDPRP